MWEGIFVNSGKKIKTDLQKKRLQTVCVHNNSERNTLDEKKVVRRGEEMESVYGNYCFFFFSH